LSPSRQEDGRGWLYSAGMAKMLVSLFLIALLGACASSTERSEECTPQWPPAPCTDAPRK